MIQSYLKKTFFVILILFSFQISKEETEFTAEGLRIYNVPCSKSKGEFQFSIEGTFDDPMKAKDNFLLDLETSDGKKIKSTCYPFSYPLKNFNCIIYIKQYPLNNVDIFIPTKPPKVTGYTFKNWEKTIGSRPGMTNRLYGITCLQQEENTFVPTSITVKDCSFIIYGDWEYENNTASLYSFSQVEIVLDNDNKDIVMCSYSNQPMSFQCDLEGDGRVKIKEKDSGETVKGCSYDDDLFVDGIKRDLSGSFYFLSNILILISILLF